MAHPAPAPDEPVGAHVPGDRTTGGDGPHVFAFAHDRRLAPVSLAFGVTRRTARVEVHRDRLVARFGPWTVDTPLANVASACVTGPFAWWRVAGPARLSLADRGLTFATSTAEGVCITFHEPVRGVEPFGNVRHPGLTVTVAEPRRLVATLPGGPGPTDRSTHEGASR